MRFQASKLEGRVGVQPASVSSGMVNCGPFEWRDDRRVLGPQGSVLIEIGTSAQLTRRVIGRQTPPCGIPESHQRVGVS